MFKTLQLRRQNSVYVWADVAVRYSHTEVNIDKRMSYVNKQPGATLASNVLKTTIVYHHYNPGSRITHIYLKSEK